MPSVSRRQALAYAVVVLALLALVGRSVVGGDETVEGASELDAAYEVLTLDESADEPGEVERVLVHVAGAVREPGVYELAAGSRVTDAVQRAGGPRARAWLDSINLAAQLVDGQQVVVPLKPSAAEAAAGSLGICVAGDAGATPTASSGGVASGPVSLSRATVSELEQLPGIGPVTAQKIVAHRDEHGPFRAVDELTAISGVGPARVEALRELVTP